LRDLVIWLLFAPLFLLEARALLQLQHALALQDGQRVEHAIAHVTAERVGSRGPEIRYEFQLRGHATRIPAMNTSGWGETWIPISSDVWQRIQQGNRSVEVVYLPEAPEANQPVGRVGYPIGDSVFSWSMFVIFDMIWLFETLQLIRNYARALTNAERRVRTRLRFWRSEPASASYDLGGPARHDRARSSARR
jgi:hypothetical protein